MSKPVVVYPGTEAHNLLTGQPAKPLGIWVDGKLVLAQDPVRSIRKRKPYNSIK